MRDDTNVREAIELDQGIERNSSCCVLNDGSGCVQKTRDRCSVCSVNLIKALYQSKVNVTVNHAPQESIGGARLPLQGLEPVDGEPLMSVTHGQCDAGPTVTFPAAGHHHSPPVGWYQTILLGNRGTCVNNLSRIALDIGAAGMYQGDVKLFLVGYQITEGTINPQRVFEGLSLTWSILPKNRLVKEEKKNKCSAVVIVDSIDLGVLASEG